MVQVVRGEWGNEILAGESMNRREGASGVTQNNGAEYAKNANTSG